jgi:L-alanine-DL-glutamate epimerase-like enolase superfamily enzyme
VSAGGDAGARVERVTVEPLDLPLREPFEISLGTQHEAHNVLVSVETDDGTVGYGEGSPLPPVTGETREAALATARAAGELLDGEPVADYRRLAGDLRDAFPGAVSALFAVETALLDAHCRERGLALSELFGGAPRPVTTDLTIPILPSEDAADRAHDAVSEGFEHLKVKTGSGVEADVERVTAVREAAPDAELKVDANQGWTPAETIRFARELRDRGVDLALIEQPVDAADIEGLRHVRERIAIPVAADEAVFTPEDAMRVVRAGAADVVNVKLGKSGPVAAAEIAAIARAANCQLMVGCMLESAIGIHTSAHVVAGLGGFDYVDLDGNLLLAEDVVPTERSPTVDIAGPGHGVVPDR